MFKRQGQLFVNKIHPELFMNTIVMDYKHSYSILTGIRVWRHPYHDFEEE